MIKVFGIIFVILIAIVGIFAQNITTQTTSLLPKASPIPFYEMTIPGLRSKTYDSQITQMEQYQENSVYTSYVATYDSEGNKVNGLLTIPKGDFPQGGWPAIVFVHGYVPPEVYETTQRYMDHVNTLARNGFVVFKIDLRGHGDSEGEPGGAYYSQDYIIDTLNAYSALQKLHFVDPNAIGLWGHSMAGNVTSRALAAKQDIPATVIWAGAGYTYDDLKQYQIDDNSYRPPQESSDRAKRRQLLRDTYGEFNATDPFWSQVAITNYIKDIKGAVQLNHAVDDNVVSIDYSRNLNKLLNEAGIVNELVEYPSGGHNMTGSSFTQAMNNTVEFFHKYLK